jgi:hypothetical protein
MFNVITQTQTDGKDNVDLVPLTDSTRGRPAGPDTTTQGDCSVFTDPNQDQNNCPNNKGGGASKELCTLQH